MTAGTDGVPVPTARTVRFNGIHDEEQLPLDNLLAYHGPVRDYLDLAWWVSRDRQDSLALSDMLREEMQNPDVQGAIGVIGSLAVAAPQAALAAAVAGACAVIVNVSYRVLSKAVGNSIGLYRTSLLANEQFGLGRHPIWGVRRAQDFSFAYEIEAT